MRARECDVLEFAIEQGVARAWTRAHKHDDNPSGQVIRDAMEFYVGESILAWFELEGRRYFRDAVECNQDGGILPAGDS